MGARGSFAETNDGGETWEPRSFSNLDAEEEITYRFQTVSFDNGEGMGARQTNVVATYQG